MHTLSRVAAVFHEKHVITQLILCVKQVDEELTAALSQPPAKGTEKNQVDEEHEADEKDDGYEEMDMKKIKKKSKTE